MRAWALERERDEKQERELALETGLSPVTVRIALSRGLTSAGKLRDFLLPKLEDLTPPERIRDMEIAVDRLVRARADGEKIWIFGDYDVDGTTGAALLTWGLRDFGYRTEARQPDRFKDGYGLNVGAVAEAADAGAGVLITIDCGISSFDAIQEAKRRGLDVIVVDHHQVDATRGIPEHALAVLNPQRADDESGLKMLCGCGVGFYLLRALRTKGRELGWWPSGQEPNLKKHLDLVVLATAADLVPLVGDNHILARFGLEVLKRTQKPGLRAMLVASGLMERELAPGALGFVLGPRINASGRMGSAAAAFDLLTTEDADQALAGAQALEAVNRERAEMQNRIWDEVRAEVDRGISEGRFRAGVVVAREGWHEGVVGIVASRVVETYRVPAIVMGIRDGIAKGSARTFGGKDVLAGIRAGAQFLKTHGGHRHAAGLSLPVENLPEFSAVFESALEALEETTEERREIRYDAVADPRELSLLAVSEIERFGPFGPGNRDPLVAVPVSVDRYQVLKGRHLKLTLSGGGGHAVGDGIWFHAAEREDVRDLGGALQGLRVEVLAVPELNRFRGQTKVSLRMKDWKILPSG